MDISKKIQAHKNALNQSTLSSGSHRELKTEQRKFPRTELSCPVEVLSDTAPDGNALAQSRTDNISNGGCYITLATSSLATSSRATSATFSPGSMVKLNLKIPRQTPNTYLLESHQRQARIVRIEPARPGKSGKSNIQENTEIGLALEFSDPCELSLD